MEGKGKVKKYFTKDLKELHLNIFSLFMDNSFIGTPDLFSDFTKLFWLCQNKINQLVRFSIEKISV